jgi:hypothetical protein
MVNAMANALAYGKSNAECISQNTKLLFSYLNALQCYIPFQAPLTFAVKINLQKIDPMNDNVLLYIDGNFITGDEFVTIHAMLDYMYNDIIDNQPNLHAELVDDTLYIYSYSSNYSFNSTVTLTSANEITFMTYEVLDTEEKQNVFLDLWNCLLTKEVDDMIKDAYKLIENTDTADCGCN